MIYKLARFTVKKDKVKECTAAIATFIAEVAEKEDGTLFYDSYVESDGVTFVHLMTFVDAATEKTHQGAPHTETFGKILYANCSVEPQFTNLDLVASTDA